MGRLAGALVFVARIAPHGVASAPRTPSTFEHSGTMPPSIVEVPLRDAADPPLVPPDTTRRIIAVLVGSDGFVERTRWIAAAPRDSDRVAARAMRWIFQPAFVAETGDTVPVWHKLPVPLQPRERLLARPDSNLVAALRAAGDAPGASELLACLLDPLAFRGPDPWLTRRRPVLRAYACSGPRGTVRMDIAPDSDWMRVRYDDELLFIAYAPLRERVLHAVDLWRPAATH